MLGLDESLDFWTTAAGWKTDNNGTEGQRKGERHRLLEVAFRWKIETRRSEVTGWCLVSKLTDGLYRAASRTQNFCSQCQLIKNRELGKMQSHFCPWMFVISLLSAKFWNFTTWGQRTQSLLLWRKETPVWTDKRCYFVEFKLIY